MKDAQVTVAIIGCGRISGHHIRSIALTPGVRLAAVCDLVADKAKAYADQYSVPFFVNYHEMLRNLREIDVVAVVTPSGMHAEHSLEIMRRYRKHLVVEKPTFMKPSQVVEAYSEAERLGLQIFPVFQNRHNLAVQRVARGLKDGELGAIRTASVRVRWCRPQRYYDLSPWRGTFAMDGGALTNQGVHHVDLLRYLSGEVVRVQTVMRTLGANIEVEDTATAVIEFANGAIGNVEVTTAARPNDYEASISFVCEKGLAQIGGIAVNELQVYTPDPSACPPNSEDFAGIVYGHGHEKLYWEISQFFKEGRAFSVSKQDCLNTIKLLSAFYRSDEEGAWVRPDSSQESTRLGRNDDRLASLYRTVPPEKVAA